MLLATSLYTLYSVQHVINVSHPYTRFVSFESLRYMQAAEQLLSGPLSRCRIESKLDRWQTAIESFMAADAAAGLYPAKEDQRGTFHRYDQLCL